MAKKLYEESNIAAIAEKIREKTGNNKTYKTSEMSAGVAEVYDAGYVIPNEQLKSLIGGSMNELDLPVGTTNIRDYCFYGMQDLQSVSIPSTVTNVGAYAFYECANLQEFYFDAAAATDKRVGEKIFDKAGTCDNGIKLIIGKNVTKIPDAMFYYAKNIVSVEFEEGSICTNIGEYAFLGCTRLAKVVIPDSVTHINRSAFNGCINLISITIGANVKTIGEYAFSGDSKLIEVYNLSKLSLKKLSLDHGGVAYNALDIYTSLEDKSKLWTDADEFIFYEDGDTRYLMGYLGNRKDASLPESCNGKDYEIYKSAFNNSPLKNVNISGNITDIHDHAFSCYDLKRAYFNVANLTETGDEKKAFSGAGRESDGFALIVGKDVVRIPQYMFYIKYNSTVHITSVEFEDGSICKSIGIDAFKTCEEIKSVYITDVEKWCNLHNNNWYANPMHAGANLYLNGELLTELIIPDTITDLGLYKFYGCTSITDVVIGNGLRTIGHNTFGNCANLKTVAILNIPDEIGSAAFDESTALTDIYVPWAEGEVANAPWGATNATIHYNTYMGTEGIIYSLLNETNYSCISYEGTDTAVVIPAIYEGYPITTIGTDAFRNNKTVTDLKIGSNITTIGYASLMNSGITNLYIPANVIDILAHSIRTPSLTSITFAEDSQLKSLQACCLHSTKISTLELPANLKTISNNACANCTNLTNVHFRGTPTTIDSTAFNNCTALTDIYVPWSESDAINVNAPWGATNATIHYNS